MEVQVDVVGPEALKRALHGDANALRTAVGDAGVSTRMREDAELRGHHHLLTAALDRPAYQLLAVERPIDLGGVDVDDTQLERTVDGADRLVVVEPPPDV